MNDAVEALARKGPTGVEVADWIRSQIRSSRLVPGQRLVEVDIIRQTGGSRFKVREAFQRLAAEGLVEIEEFRGASVRGASMDEVRQLYRARAALEGICAAEFALKATDEQRRKLADLADEMEVCVEGGAPERFGQLNSDWHSLLMRGAGNAVIEDIVKRLNTPVHHLLFETFYKGDRLREAARDHRLIVKAVLDRDGPAAEMAMRQHIENGHRFLTDLDRAVHHGGVGEV
ncbi:GntR family transcriptional regulator [Altererythrobacter sp. KTW20L]|uniref:GntR family transcriptional regulator n=1 Tax=Altererythrobacter sp. KTW20L TaxID=2942210 RepID=UPI0020BEC655|nr:GntR family transcriptional regulator [Altererythrobacter sp. KTW20L]MCL6249709.1 GntR family transcriptional regulator [Altererythrobacter sp. KTW20L]